MLKRSPYRRQHLHEGVLSLKDEHSTESRYQIRAPSTSRYFIFFYLKTLHEHCIYSEQ